MTAVRLIGNILGVWDRFRLRRRSYPGHWQRAAFDAPRMARETTVQRAGLSLEAAMFRRSPQQSLLGPPISVNRRRVQCRA